MRISLTLEGAQDLSKRLADLSSTVSLQVQTAALRAGAAPIRDAQEANAPVGDDPPHMADNIRISVPSANERADIGSVDQAMVAIGPTRGFFYASFQEFGTAFHPAQAFMRPAFDATAKQALEIVLAHMWKAVVKRLGSDPARARGQGSSGVGL